MALVFRYSWISPVYFLHRFCTYWGASENPLCLTRITCSVKITHNTKDKNRWWTEDLLVVCVTGNQSAGSTGVVVSPVFENMVQSHMFAEGTSPAVCHLTSATDGARCVDSLNLTTVTQQMWYRDPVLLGKGQSFANPPPPP